jgi:diacylglycerol kinase family enzyme
MQTPLVRVSIHRVRAVVNPASGGVEPGTAEALSALLAERGLDHQVSEIGPRRVEETLRAARDASPDLIVVVGGDGTARAAAELCGPTGPLVAPLSGGTMNKLGHALYGVRPWREALSETLDRGEPRWISGGEAGGRAFFCSAMLGSPALLARAREAVRAHRFSRAAKRTVVAFRNAFLTRLSYEFDGSAIGHGPAVGFICPTISRALDEGEGALEAAEFDLQDTRAGVRLALHYLLDDWREDPHVTVRRCVGARLWARNHIPAMLDGEFFRLGRRVEVRFRSHAFRALGLPADREGQG